MESYTENKSVLHLTAFDVLHAKTEPISNALEIIVMCLLPLPLFCGGKHTILLLYMNIKMPNNHEETESQSLEFCSNLQMCFIILGVGPYWLHRRWRLCMHYRRADELQILWQKLEKYIDAIIEERIT